MDIFLDKETMFKKMLSIIYLWLSLSLNFAPHHSLWCTRYKSDEDEDDYFSAVYLPNFTAAQINQLSRLGERQSREDKSDPQVAWAPLTLSMATMLTSIYIFL